MANESTEHEYKEVAPDGQLWVCGACGKNGKDRAEIGDASCFLNAILCYEKKNHQGEWVGSPRSEAMSDLDLPATFYVVSHVLGQIHGPIHEHLRGC